MKISMPRPIVRIILILPNKLIHRNPTVKLKKTMPANELSNKTGYNATGGRTISKTKGTTIKNISSIMASLKYFITLFWSQLNLRLAFDLNLIPNNNMLSGHNETYDN